MAYEVDITPEGLRHLNRLPERVRVAVIEAIFGTIAENPHRAGKPLRGELEGLYSARRGDFRIIYEVDEEAKLVLVHRAQHRRKVYRRQ
ncbi:MAG: type II toxin-antitoxin system RelE/ParE family toxin [Actinobacteria bacterium]|nr:type II toxin-antitoxin system RelE/ParE family toxin [Actinomycetota bacterium]